MKILKNVTAYFATIAALVSLAIPLMAPVAVQAQSAPDLCYTFTQNLGEGRPLSSQDAAALATNLVNAGLWNANTPITTYNDVVASAVSGFQEKYAAEILAPYGLTYGTGFVGVSTRAQLNQLSTGGCGTTNNPSQPVQCPAGYTCTPINQSPAPVCPAGWTCTPTTPTQPVNPTNPYLSISSISPAPTSLIVGQSGYWVVNAVDTRGNYGGVKYSVNWGDQSTDGGQITNSFTHSYSNPGLYTVTFTVTEVSTGLTVQSSVTVNVGNSSTQQPPVITGITAPTTLSVGQTGTWAVSAYDPQNG
jgi:hypothetical protein